MKRSDGILLGLLLQCSSVAAFLSTTLMKTSPSPLLRSSFLSSRSQSLGLPQIAPARSLRASMDKLQMKDEQAPQTPQNSERVTVLGGGSFGLAMASILGKKKYPVKILVRTQDAMDSINIHHRSSTYLKDVTLPDSVTATCDKEEALKDATLIIHAVPVQYSRKFLKEMAPYVPKDCPVICTSKGIETGTLCLMQDILREELGDSRDYAFLSGPSFAREIAVGLATAVVVASQSDTLTNRAAEIFGCENFRVFTSKDVIGVEIGGAVKNVIAIAAGMCEGLGLGTNAVAGLVTRGCLEMQTLARAVGASPSTLMGLSGVGDTFGTCFGPLSRNRNLGIRLGQGEKLEDILSSSTEVAEGYATALSLVEFLLTKMPRSFRMDLKFPILFGVAEVLKGERSPREGMKDLMLMPIRTEIFDYSSTPRILFPKTVKKRSVRKVH
mmetsp:Transcript_42410/g.133594  ORF Transcript_42410/g.133594 Transcript_42410/m.133594 type:complete len:441 (-) Transcript_42410:257-1579(-)